MSKHLERDMEQLQHDILDMGAAVEEAVTRAVRAVLDRDADLAREVIEGDTPIDLQENQVEEDCLKILALHQPVATDLRFIKSCMEIAYGFSRFGRYAHDISDVFGIFGDLSSCDKSSIREAGEHTKSMIHLSIKAFNERDVELANKVRKMDDIVDSIYLGFVKRAAQGSGTDLKCTVSGTLILRYLERIADHATYVGESVLYITSGERSPRK